MDGLKAIDGPGNVVAQTDIGLAFKSGSRLASGTKTS